MSLCKWSLEDHQTLNGPTIEKCLNSISINPSFFFYLYLQTLYLQKHSHFWFFHELDSWFNQFWHSFQVIRILLHQGADMFQFLLLGSSDYLCHLIFSFFQYRIEIVKFFTQLFFLSSAAFLWIIWFMLNMLCS